MVARGNLTECWVASDRSLPHGVESGTIGISELHGAIRVQAGGWKALALTLLLL
jgi:hypothetical protein